MKSKIVVSFNMPGLHNWPGVVDTKYAKTQGYLAHMHRHVFFFKATKSVSHDDRDIEIIDLRNRMEDYLKRRYGWTQITGTVHFGSRSCEMLGQELVRHFDLSSCEVLEDNENGAISFPGPVKEIDDGYEDCGDRGGVDGSNITFICSFLQSGKSTLTKGFQKSLKKIQVEAVKIEVSDIVSKALKETERSKLQGHPELDKHIIDEIRQSADYHDQVIVSGARQVSILKAFPKASLIWIDVPEAIRYERFKTSKKDSKDSFSDFILANQRDRELGLYDVRKYIFNQDKTNR